MSSEADERDRREPVGLADTSVFIAREGGRTVGSLPERLAVSVITLGELQLGVLNAADRATRARRAETLELVRRSDPIPVSEAVMSRWAQLARDCAKAGQTRGVKVMDGLIAATAVEHGLPLVTQDAGFDLMAAAHPALDLIKV